jgi:dTDP-4-dehydrorhamnose 3,5-epimerase-like enzyme
MDVRELDVADAFEITPRQLADERGVFLEWYRVEAFMKARGHALDVRQATARFRPPVSSGGFISPLSPRDRPSM